MNNQVIIRLRRELDGSFHVVARPDHPMLLSGPDLLIGGEGRLTAALLLDGKESEKSLLARITATRLAMPSTTRLLALLTEDTEPPPQILDHFDSSASERDWQEIQFYATSDARPKVDQAALSESKRKHTEKYAFAMLLTTLRRKHELTTVEPETVIRELANTGRSDPVGSTKMPQLRWPSTRVQGAYVASLSSRHKPVQQLRTLCSTGLVDSYALDTGIPYQKSDSNLNVLLIEQWPTVRNDPEKPVRSAAFGGWIMAKSSSALDIFYLIERSRNTKFISRWNRA